MTTTDTATPSAIELARALDEGRATVTVDHTSLDALNCDCVQEGAAWPDATLTITLGDWSWSTGVWYVAAWCDGVQGISGGPNARRGWQVDSSDGAYSGAPRVEVEGDDEDGYTIRVAGGANIGVDIALDAGSDEAAAAQAAEQIRTALENAYGDIEVPEPDDEDIIQKIGDADPTHVEIDEDGEPQTSYRPDGLHVTISHRKLLGRHYYALRASGEPRWYAEDTAYHGAEAAGRAALELLADMAERAEERIRKVEWTAILAEKND